MLSNQAILSYFKITKHNVMNKLEWIGWAQMMNGNLFIFNTDTNSPWIFICKHSSQDTYLCLESSYIKLSQKQQVNGVEIISSPWYGQKYDQDGKILYQGDFVYFKKNYQKNESLDLEYDNDGNILSVYKGKFNMNMKHDEKGQMITRDENISGIWQLDNKQGEFNISKNKGFMSLINNIKSKFNPVQVINYYNDYPNTKGKEVSLPLKYYDFEEIVRYNVVLSKNVYDSLDPGNWLESAAVDYFFKHLQNSFDDYLQMYKRNVRCFTVFMFEKMISSALVYSRTREINHEPVKQMGKVFDNVTSIFQEYPLILLPLNENRSHFILTAIESKVQRKIETRSGRTIDLSVQFTLYHLDPLGCNSIYSQSIVKHLLTYITKQIEQNIKSKIEIQIFKNAIKASEYKVVSSENFKYSKQNNFDDCGIFTCLYGASLAIEKGLGKKVRWDQLHEASLGLRRFIQKCILEESRDMLRSLIQLFQKHQIVE